MSRGNKILALLLVTQVAMIAYLYRPGRVSTPEAVQFFRGVEAAKVTGLSIDDGTRSVTISKEGEGWIIDGGPRYPADGAKAQGLVDKLLNLASSRLVARTGSSHGRLKVAADRFNRKLTLHLADGGQRVLRLGSAPTYKSIHVRCDKDDAVYLVKDLADWEAPVENESWWATNYVDVKVADLRAVKLTNGLGRIELVRGSDGKWRAEGVPPGMALADEGLRGFLDRVSQIRLASYLGREKEDSEFGLDRPLVELELVTPAGTTRLKVAARSGQGEEYVMKASDSPFYVLARGQEVKGLSGARLSGLLAPVAMVGASGKEGK